MLEKYIRLVQDMHQGCKTAWGGGRSTPDIIALCGDVETDMTYYWGTWRKTLEERGMMISRPKTELMDFNFGLDNGQEREPVKILGQELSVDETRGTTTEITQRMSAAWRNWKRCIGVLFDRRMPVKLMGKVYKTEVRSALLYDADT